MKPIRRVLFATDFSTASRGALATAIRLARSTGAGLTLVSVIVPLLPAMPEQYIDATTLDALEKQEQQWGTRQLRRLAAAATRAGVAARVRLLNGDPVAQIVRAARAERADLIVLGTHGRRGLSRFFMGSVAERVVRTAPYPVVTVRRA